MSKPVKQLIMADYRRRFESLEGALVIDIALAPALLRVVYPDDST